MNLNFEKAQRDQKYIKDVDFSTIHLYYNLDN